MKKDFYITFLILISIFLFPSIAEANMAFPLVLLLFQPISLIFLLILLIIEAGIAQFIISRIAKIKKLGSIIKMIFWANFISTLPGLLLIPAYEGMNLKNIFWSIILSFIVTLLIEWLVYVRFLGSILKEGDEAKKISKFWLGLIVSFSVNIVSYTFIVLVLSFIII